MREQTAIVVLFALIFDDLLRAVGAAVIYSDDNEFIAAFLQPVFLSVPLIDEFTDIQFFVIAGQERKQLIH